jgi:hypothetical protein
MQNNTELLCLILEFQSRSLIVQGLLQAEGTKEYEAKWLKNADTVVRDGSGKFAKKGASIAQPVQNTTDILKQGFELTTDTIQSLLKDPEFRKRAGLAVGLPMARLISLLAKKVSSDPKFSKKLDDFIDNATKELTNLYGDDKTPMGQAIRKANLVKPPKDASFNEKMEFRFAQYAAYEDALKKPEHHKNKDELIGKATNAAIPIAACLLAIAAPEVVAAALLAASGDVAGASVSLAGGLLGTALIELLDVAIHKGMDKIGLESGTSGAIDGARIGASIGAGLFTGGLVQGIGMGILRSYLDKRETENTPISQGKSSIPEGG